MIELRQQTISGNSKMRAKLCAMKVRGSLAVEYLPIEVEIRTDRPTISDAHGENICKSCSTFFFRTKTLPTIIDI